MSTGESAGAEHAVEGAVESTADATVESTVAPTADPTADPADARADLTVLDELDGRPLHEHVAVYDELHARLQGALNRIDEA